MTNSSPQPSTVSRFSPALKSLRKGLIAFFTPAVLLIYAIPFIITLFIGIWGLVFFWNDGVAKLRTGIEAIPWLSDSTRWLFSFVGSDGGALLTFLSAVAFILLFFLLIYLLVTLFTALVLVPMMIPVIHSKYFPKLEKKSGGSFFTSFKVSLFASGVYILVLILLFPLFFIPGVQLVVPLVLNSYVAKTVFPYDVLQDYASKQEMERLVARENQPGLWALAMACSMFFYVPFVNILAPGLMAITFIFYCFDQLTQLRENATGV